MFHFQQCQCLSPLNESPGHLRVLQSLGTQKLMEVPASSSGPGQGEAEAESWALHRGILTQGISRAAVSNDKQVMNLPNLRMVSEHT